MLDQILRRYCYKNYFDLLKDRDFEKFLLHEGWIRPAVIPRSVYTYPNLLIRKYLTGGRKELIKDEEFQKILYKVGFTRYVTTTSTTTTTTTTP